MGNKYFNFLLMWVISLNTFDIFIPKGLKAVIYISKGLKALKRVTVTAGVKPSILFAPSRLFPLHKPFNSLIMLNQE